MLTMLTTLFSSLFDRDALLRRARELNAIQRVKELPPADMLLALVRSSVGDEHPSVATARRQLHAATGYMPEESSFYERITPGLGDLGWDVFLRTLAGSTRVQRRQIAKALGLRSNPLRNGWGQVGTPTLDIRSYSYLKNFCLIKNGWFNSWDWSAMFSAVIPAVQCRATPNFCYQHLQRKR